MAKSRLPIMVGRKQEEVERYVMPWLLTETEDSKPLVTVSNKGYVLTDVGINLCNQYGYMAQPKAEDVVADLKGEIQRIINGQDKKKVISVLKKIIKNVEGDDDLENSHIVSYLS